MQTKYTFCRICLGRCGLVVDIDETTDRIVKIRGDFENPMTKGFACIKGLEAGEIHQGDQRLLKPLERQPDGSFSEVELEVALDRIAARMQGILDEEGPDAIAIFRGTQHYINSAALEMLTGFIRALGTRSRFSTMTIDQSAKWVTDHRLGVWAAGKQRFESADVWMFVGNNPLVSLSGAYGFPALNPAKRLKDAKAKGLKIIVVDPRKTEMTHYADVHLQIYPGEDPATMAGLLNIILQNDWHDQAFCDQYVDGLSELKRAVAFFTPEYVSQRAGVDESLLHQAAEIFAHQSNRGIAASGTGPDMAPRSNLAEHLIETLNVVCGRFTREGERVANHGPMSRKRTVRAEVIAPTRPWEGGRKSRVRNLGMINGEKMSGVLAEEILTPGEGQIRAMLIDGGNPANSLPDRKKAIEALSALDLLIVIDPFLSETAELADYVLPPTMMFEYAAVPFLFEKTLFPEPFVQYSEAIIAPPEGSDVADSWYVFWALAKRLGLPMRFAGVELDMREPPTSEMLLEILLRDAQVSLEELKEYPRGKVVEIEPIYVSGARPQREGNRFQVAPEDICGELAIVAAETRVNEVNGVAYPFRLSVRRDRTAMNTSYRQMTFVKKRLPSNPLWMNPEDMTRLNLTPGDTALLQSSHGEISVKVADDTTMRPGVVSMTHGWGGRGGDISSGDLTSSDESIGVSVNDLIPLGDRLEEINGMPWYSALPVSVRAS